MKTTLLYLSLLIIGGCNLNFPANKTSSGCSEKPTAVLTKENLKNITLTNQTITESNQVSDTKAVGYTFQGKSGKTLSYNTDDDVCIWLYSPDNQILNGTKLLEEGKYTLQIAAPKGSKTFTIKMSLETIVASPSPTPSISLSPSSSPSPSPSSYELTEDEARKIVEGWYAAKPEVFGSSFDRSLVAKYTTGKLYSNTLEKCNDGVCGGSVGWLRRYGCYYTYDFSDINKVVSFNPSGSPPSLTVNIRERLTLHGPRSFSCGTPTQTYQKNVIYWFQKDNGIWKIVDYEVKT